MAINRSQIIANAVTVLRSSRRSPLLPMLRCTLGTAACITALLLTSFFAAAIVVVPLVSLQAQQQVQDDGVVRVNTDLVLLNITATDPLGKYVRNLRRSDFRIFENNQEQIVNTFGLEETPFAAAVLLDTSGSMEGRLSLARSAAIRFLDGLRPDDVAAVYRFDSEVEQMQEFSPGRDLAPLTYSVRAEGWTALNDAIKRAATDLIVRPEKRRAIIVLSDGADTRSRINADAALASALAAQATIYTVDMSDQTSSSSASFQNRHLAAAALRNFAAKSGGRYVSTPGGQALRDAFAGITEELSNQYTIGYQPSNRARDGRWRAIDVKLTRPNATIRTRPGYRAPKKA